MKKCGGIPSSPPPMCFYLYAPNNKLVVEFASETIALHKNLSSTISIDLLIKNHSSQSLPSLHIVYPRAGILIHDQTSSFLIDDHPANRFLRNPVYNWRKQDLRDGRWQCAFNEPDPERPSVPVDHTGMIFGGCTIQPLAALTREHRQILSHRGINASLLDCRFDRPIDPGESRWLRWSVRPERVTDNPRSLFGHATDWMLDRLIHNYTIVGPEDVKNDLRLRLLALAKSSDDLGNLALHSGTLLAFLDQHLRGTQTDIQDWRLHLLPGFFRHLRDIEWQGNVTQPIPTRIEFPPANLDTDRCYQCRSGWKGALSGQTPGQFTLTFTVKHPGRIVKFILFAGAVAGIIALLFELRR